MRTLLALLLVGCATPNTPYTVEYPLAPMAVGGNAWFTEGPGKSLCVVNPPATRCHAEVTVTCSHPEERWVVSLPVATRTCALTTFLNRDQMTNVCRVVTWRCDH